MLAALNVVTVLACCDWCAYCDTVLTVFARLAGWLAGTLDCWAADLLAVYIYICVSLSMYAMGTIEIIELAICT